MGGGGVNKTLNYDTVSKSNCLFFLKKYTLYHKALGLFLNVLKNRSLLLYLNYFVLCTPRIMQVLKLASRSTKWRLCIHIIHIHSVAMGYNSSSLTTKILGEIVKDFLSDPPMGESQGQFFSFSPKLELLENISDVL